MSVISMKQLLEAGVHFGHQTRKWNPKMGKYIFTARNDIHIINLEQTEEQVKTAYKFVKDAVDNGANVLFVGTKKQAQDAVKEEAIRSGMFYINSRWLGGTLTNFKTIRSRVERLNFIDKMEKLGEFDLLPKKEVAKLKHERDNLDKNLGGIREMVKLPGLIFVVDSKKEHICIKEAKKLGIPVVGLIDTNCNPDDVDVVIAGNDDAIRSVKLIASVMANAVIEAREGVQFSAEDVSDEATFEALIETGEVLNMPVEKEEVEEAKKPAKKAAPKAAKKVAEVKEEAKKTTTKKVAEAKEEKSAAKKATTKKVAEAKEEKPAAKKATTKKAAEAKEEKPAAKKTTAKKATAKTEEAK